MRDIDERDLGYLEEAMLTARGEAWLRWVTLPAIGLCFTPLVGWTFALPWLVATLLVSEWAAPRFERGASMAADPKRWAIHAMLATAAIRAVVGSLAVIACVRGGLWGLVSGELLIFSLVLISTAAARRSRLGYLAAMAPLVVYLAALGVLSFTLSANLAGPIVLCVSSILVLAHNHQVAATNLILAIEAEEARAEAEAARAVAEASTAAKSSFVAMVSHELRTPLSGILAGAAELAQTAPDAKSRSNAGMVTQAAQMMRTLLNDLLDLSKIEAGRMGVETIAFDLRATVLETIRFWRPELRRKNLYLRLEGAHDLPRWVEGDPTRLRQILNNLFSNSTKFTSAGGLTLSMAAVAQAERRVRITLSVGDTGPGMSEDQMGRLFAAFEQLSASTARAHGGTGLGLHISREFARLMGGDITVVSALGAGSTFQVALTLPTCAPALPTEAPYAPSDLPGIHLLIVDDHQVNRQAFSLILEPFAARIDCVEDGEQALAILAVQAFDLVLMDIHMPNLDGRETTMRLRSIPGPNQNTPVIALTGSVSSRDVDTYLAAGMNAFVMKPVTPRELLTAIDQVLDADQGASYPVEAETEVASIGDL